MSKTKRILLRLLGIMPVIEGVELAILAISNAGQFAGPIAAAMCVFYPTCLLFSCLSFSEFRKNGNKRSLLAGIIINAMLGSIFAYAAAKNGHAQTSLFVTLSFLCAWFGGACLGASSEANLNEEEQGTNVYMHFVRDYGQSWSLNRF